jgi:hypothetical protein
MDKERHREIETRWIMVKRAICRRQTVNLKQQKQRERYKEKQVEEM